jgi:Beta-ketoacyl synthase, N-terminal domain
MTVTSEREVACGLTVHARAEWPAGTAEVPPPIAGFVVSSFNPLVAEVAQRCLRAHYGTPPADPVRGERTGVVLASIRGDVTTADAVAQALRTGRRVPPLLFFQSNPNAVLGHVTARWGLGGPVVCISPAGDALAGGLAAAALLLADGDATEVLVIAADLAVTDAPPGSSPPPDPARPDPAPDAYRPAEPVPPAPTAGTGDHAVALLVGPPADAPADAPVGAPVGAFDEPR